MAHRKAGGTAKNLRDSQPKYLGTKLYAGEEARPGMVIVRQRGTKVFPGKNVKMGRQNTLYALKSGIIGFITKKIRGFDKAQRKVKIVSIQESTNVEESNN